MLVAGAPTQYMNAFKIASKNFLNSSLRKMILIDRNVRSVVGWIMGRIFVMPLQASFPTRSVIGFQY